MQRDFEHCDLLHICRKRGLRGGLKRVEMLLGIARSTTGISGWMRPGSGTATRHPATAPRSDLLLEYNREDVVNLAVLDGHLGLTEQAEPRMAVQHIFT